MGFSYLLSWSVVQLTKPHHNFVVFREIESVLRVAFISGRGLGQSSLRPMWRHIHCLKASTVVCLVCQQDLLWRPSSLSLFAKRGFQTWVLLHRLTHRMVVSTLQMVVFILVCCLFNFWGSYSNFTFSNVPNYICCLPGWVSRTIFFE